MLKNNHNFPKFSKSQVGKKSLRNSLLAGMIVTALISTAASASVVSATSSQNLLKVTSPTKDTSIYYTKRTSSFGGWDSSYEIWKDKNGNMLELNKDKPLDAKEKMELSGATMQTLNTQGELEFYLYDPLLMASKAVCVEAFEEGSRTVTYFPKDKSSLWPTVVKDPQLINMKDYRSYAKNGDAIKSRSEFNAKDIIKDSASKIFNSQNYPFLRKTLSGNVLGCYSNTEALELKKMSEKEGEALWKGLNKQQKAWVEQQKEQNQKPKWWDKTTQQQKEQAGYQELIEEKA